MERFNSFSSDQIVLTKRQVSMIMASMLLFCLFIFIVGFFLGKRMVMDDFSSQITKETIHDQIDFLLTTQSLESSQNDQIATIEAEPLDTAIVSDDFSEDEIVLPAVIMHDSLQQVPVVFAEKNSAEGLPGQEKFKENFQEGKQYAQLIGFGTKKAAQAFVSRLKKHNITVILKTMISKTASGKQRTWYQAITPNYESMQELQDQVSKIKRLEHIRDKDIKIVHLK